MSKAWCGRRDLNPGYRLGRPVSWTRLDYGRSRCTELFLWGIWVKVFRNSLSGRLLSLFFGSVLGDDQGVGFVVRFQVYDLNYLESVSLQEVYLTPVNL